MIYDDDTQEIDMSKILSPAPNVVRVDFKPGAPPNRHHGLKALDAPQPWIWPMKALAVVMILLLSLLML